MMEKLIEFTSKTWNDYAIIIKYKRSLFRLLVSDLPEINQKLLKAHRSGEYNITGSALLKGGKIIPDSLTLNFNNYGIPVKLKTHKLRETEYVTYHYKKETVTKSMEI